ncbi:MAG: dipeptide ABC transporter ATP-binding protein [Terriglobia bacterium]
MGPLLQVHDLTVGYEAGGARVAAVSGVSFEVAPGEALGVLGESGCGKTTTALAILGILPETACVAGGSIRFRGRDLSRLRERELQKVRGSEISMIFQEPAMMLSPVKRAGDQVAEVIRAHSKKSWPECRTAALARLMEVGFQSATRVYSSYPHQLSGGERQRVAIAQAVACRPALVIADEPTASLDLTTQAEILDLLRDLKERLGIALLAISHDPGVLTKLATRVMVMRRGELVEQGRLQQVFDRPQNAYTYGLLVARASRPLALGRPAPVLESAGEDAVEARALGNTSAGKACPERSEGMPAPQRAGRPRYEGPLVSVRGLSKRYRQRRWLRTFSIQALHNVDLEIPAGSTVALMGESGSGKSTLAWCLARLLQPDAGEIRFAGRDLLRMPPRELAGVRQKIQLIFQDSAQALNPRFSAAEVVSEPLDIQAIGATTERRARALELMEQVGLSAAWAGRSPLEFSGGQRQRLAIARALTLRPSLLILDEALTGLDRPIQAEIIDLLGELQIAHGLTYLYISHDLNLVERLADEVVVMHEGRIVERAGTAELLRRPSHPHTQALISSRLEVEPALSRGA